MESARSTLVGIVNNIKKVIVGKQNTIELIVTAMAASGHVLIEDIPGVGKTSLVYALARSIDCGFSRIQFTPDTLPSDITGFSVFSPKTNEFEFRAGAVFSNFILADEINRATPKTQASLLETMEEKQVTVDSSTYELREPFMVLATQNPIEYLGTYPLPEAQVDRFMIRVSLGYPEPEQEMDIISRDTDSAKAALSPVTDATGIADIKDAVEKVRVDKDIRGYMVAITTATRNHSDIQLGASPRGSISLYRMCRAYALYKGRDYVLPDDVKLLAPYVLGHRLILSQEAKLAKRSVDRVLKEILGEVAVPAV